MKQRSSAEALLTGITAMSSSNEKEVDHLEREVEETRANVSETLDALQNQVSDTVQEWRGRLTVEEISKEVKGYARDSAERMVHSTGQRIGRMAHERPALTAAFGLAAAWPFLKLAAKVPLPFYLIGAGAYMMKPVQGGDVRTGYNGGYRPSGYGSSFAGERYQPGNGGRAYNAQEGRDFRSDGGESAGIGDYASMAAEKVGDLGSRATDFVGGLARRAQSAVSSMTGHSGEQSTRSYPDYRSRGYGDRYSDQSMSPSRGSSSALHDAADVARGAVRGATDTALGAVHGVADAATQTAHRVVGAASDLAHDAAGYASSAASSASYAATRAASYSRQHAPTNFWILSGLGLAIGATIAATLPQTRTENRLVGRTSDQMKRRAREMANSGMEEARETLARAYEVALEEAEARGLTPEAAKEAAQDFVSKIGQTAQRAARDNDGRSELAGQEFRNI